MGGLVASQDQAGVPRGPPGQACRGALGSRDPPSLSAARPAVSAEVIEGQAPCRGPGGDAALDTPRTRVQHFRRLSHFPTAPRGSESGGTARGSLCALAVCWDFFLGQHPPPFSSRKSCGFPRRRKEKLAATPPWQSFPSRTLKNSKGWAIGSFLGSSGGSEGRIPSPGSLPPGPAVPLPRPGLGPASSPEPPATGSRRVKPRNVAARNVHANEPSAGRGGAGRMLIACK